MHIVDYVIIFILAFYIGWVLKKYVFGKKDNCTGICATCSSSSCSLENLKKDMKDYQKDQRKQG